MKKKDNDTIVFDNEIQLPATMDKLHGVMAWVKDKLDQNNCPMNIENQIAVITEELFVNISSYAYNGKTGAASIRLTLKDETIVLQFEDSGIPFNPLEHASRNKNTSVESLEIGGLGISITKKWSNSIEYLYKNGKNILTITKTIPNLQEKTEQ
ncbi:MAG: ATP-binding protein [Spirochaetaceae bacterium]|jgi:anti-sigma regulatory factor (Ser/Thr protein kinase)|nr:ATP-binding protein [Spirochaetaceae bacterium]